MVGTNDCAAPVRVSDSRGGIPTAAFPRRGAEVDYTMILIFSLDGKPFVFAAKYAGTIFAVPSQFFPTPFESTPDGLVAVGGDLSPERLLDAYRHGIFPWPVFADEDLNAWWSPDPRTILELDDLRISTRLQ